MLTILAFISGGLARVIDGTGKVKGSNVLMALVAGLVAFWAIDDPIHAVLIAGFSGWALQKGFDGWERFSFQQITHYWPAVIPWLYYVYEGSSGFFLLYPVFALIAGLAHPVLALLERKLFNGWHYTRYAEFIAGAAVIGPWGFL